MGMVDLTTNSATYIGDVNPWLPRGGVAGIAQSGSVTDAFIHSGNRIGFSRIIGCGSEVVLDVVRLPRLLRSTTPRPHAVILFLEGFKRPERFLALADRALELGKPVMVVKVGRSRAGPGRGDRPFRARSPARTGRPTPRCAAAGVIRCDDLDELLETAELVAGCRRLGRRVGRGRTGVVTVSTGEASLIADLAPRTGRRPADGPATPPGRRCSSDLPTLGYIGNPLDPWGATDPTTAYGAAFDAFADSGAYDVLALVHDFPYRSLAVGGRDGPRGDRGRCSGRRRDRPDAAAGLRLADVGRADARDRRRSSTRPAASRCCAGRVEAFRAIASVARWEAAQARRLRDGPSPAGLAGPRGRPDAVWAHDAGAEPASEPAPAPRARRCSERDSLALLAAAGVPVTRGRCPRPTPTAAAAAAAELGFPVALKLDAVGPRPQDRRRRRPARPARTRPRSVAPPRTLLALGERLRSDGADVRGLLVEPMAPPGLELIVGLGRDPQFGPVVLVGLGGILAEALDDVVVRLAPLDRDEALAMLDGLRGAPAPRRRPRSRRPSTAPPSPTSSSPSAGSGSSAPDIVAIDLNPLIAGPSGAVAVDALVVLAGDREPTSRSSCASRRRGASG